MTKEELSELRAAEYYSIDRMSKSAMMHFHQSPRHYLYQKKFPKEPTAAMIFGNCYHTYVLEHRMFDQRYFVLNPEERPEQSKGMTSNQNKEWKQFTLFDKRQKGIQVIDPEDLLKCEQMFNELKRHEFAMELINNLTDIEYPLFWEDYLTGVKMKGKLDGKGTGFESNVITKGLEGETHQIGHYKIDLKTCNDAKPEKFLFDAFKLKYHWQVGIYQDGSKAMGEPVGSFYFIAQEKEPPYAVSVLKATKPFIEQGRLEYQKCLENYQFWEQMGKPDVGYTWFEQSPGHEQFSDLVLPPWFR